MSVSINVPRRHRIEIDTAVSTEEVEAARKQAAERPAVHPTLKSPEEQQFEKAEDAMAALEVTELRVAQYLGFDERASSLLKTHKQHPESKAIEFPPAATGTRLVLWPGSPRAAFIVDTAFEEQAGKDTFTVTVEHRNGYPPTPRLIVTVRMTEA